MSNYLEIPKEILFDCISFVSSKILSEKKPTSTATRVMETPKVDFSMIIERYNSSPWLKIAAIAGAASVVLGAYGAHGLKFNDKNRIKIYETANKYHFYHSLALLAVPLMKRPTLVGSLFSCGIIIFCGTCYYSSITNNDFVTRFTPIGGFMFILGWLAMLI